MSPRNPSIVRGLNIVLGLFLFHFPGWLPFQIEGFALPLVHGFWIRRNLESDALIKRWHQNVVEP
jgi:hypothetical protein